MPTRMGFPRVLFQQLDRADGQEEALVETQILVDVADLELRTAVVRLVHHRELVLHQAHLLLDVVLEGARAPAGESAVGTIASASGVEGLGVACPPLACPGCRRHPARTKEAPSERGRARRERRGTRRGAETPRPLPRARDANASDGRRRARAEGGEGGGGARRGGSNEGGWFKAPQTRSASACANASPPPVSSAASTVSLAKPSLPPRTMRCKLGN